MRVSSSRSFVSSGLIGLTIARKYLEKLILAACPEQKNFLDWEKLVAEKLEFVKVEAFARMWKRIKKHEYLFDEFQ